jgi:cytochrome c553
LTGETADAGGGGMQQTGGNDILQLTYAPMYSAYVEGHEALVPIMFKDTSLRGKGAKFTSSDPSVATVTDNDKGGLITVKKDGTTTIRVSLDGETGAAKLTVTKFSEAQWAAGRDRYSKSELALSSPTGGSISALLLQDPKNRNANGACNTCHTEQAKALKIENTPTQIAGYSDAELITIFTKGMKPEGVAQRTRVPDFAWGTFHAWEVTEDEKQGLIAYLRTQTPKDNPAMVDYGVKPCPGSPVSASGIPEMLCDNDGNPLSFPGLPGADAGATNADAGASDAGAVSDAGAASDAS